MTIHTCDKCGATLDQDPLQVGIGFYRVELCKQCGEPLIAFLKDANLLHEQLRRYGFMEPTQEESKPVSFTTVQTKANAAIKPGTPPLKDVSAFYETKKVRL